MRADVLLRLERADDAIELLKHPYAQTFCSAENFLALGLLLLEAERDDDAEAVFRQGSAVLTDSYDTLDKIHRHLAHFAARRGRFDDARALIFRNTDRQSYIQRHHVYASLLFFTHHEAEAVDTLRQARQLPGYGAHDTAEMVIQLHDAQCYQPAGDLWKAAIDEAVTTLYNNMEWAEETNDGENAEPGTEPEAPACLGILAYAAYQLKDTQFAVLIGGAVQYDLLTAFHLLGDKIDFADHDLAIDDALRLSENWKRKK